MTTRKLATLESVRAAITELKLQGAAISADAILSITGGSKTSVCRYLRELTAQADAALQPISAELTRIGMAHLHQLALISTDLARQEWAAERDALQTQLFITEADYASLDVEFLRQADEIAQLKRLVSDQQGQIKQLEGECRRLVMSIGSAKRRGAKG